MDLFRVCVTINKAAAMVSVSRRTIYNWLDKGMLDYVRTPSGAPRIFVDSLFHRDGEVPAHLKPPPLRVLDPPAGTLGFLTKDEQMEQNVKRWLEKKEAEKQAAKQGA